MTNRSRRVLLLNPPFDNLVARDKYCSSVSKTAYYWPQVDLLAISGRLARDHHVDVIDAIAERLSVDACFERIVTGRYDTVVFLTATASWRADFSFVERVKQCTGATTIASGGFLLSMGERALRDHPFLDAVLLDFTADDIVHYLDGDLENPRHMVLRRGDDIVTGVHPAEGPFSYPIPRHEKFPLRRYWFPLTRHRTFTAALTSMGCPHDCSFCVPGSWGYRARDVGNALEELEAIRRLGIREVLFQDPCFGAHRRQARELLDGMIAADLGLEWMCQTRVNLVDDERLRKMMRAGCHTIQFGVESGDQEVLDSTGKGIRLEDVRQVFELCHDHGIRTNAFYIIGLPGDDVSTISSTIDLALELDSDFATFALPMPQLGTRLGEEVLGDPDQVSSLPTMDDVSPPSYTVTNLSPEELWRLKKRAYRRFYFRPSYVARRIAGLSSVREFALHARAALALVRKR